MKIAAARAQRCSTVIWDVGGTLVDHVVGRSEALARALGAVGLVAAAGSPESPVDAVIGSLAELPQVIDCLD